MPKLPPAISKRRHHRASGQAIVVIAGQINCLGPWRSKASKIEYDRLIGEWPAASRPQQLAPECDATVVELANHYWQFAKGYYVKDGRPTVIAGVKVALHWLNKYYGHTQPVKFGPLALKALQMRMVEAGPIDGQQIIDGLVAARFKAKCDAKEDALMRTLTNNPLRDDVAEADARKEV